MRALLLMVAALCAATSAQAQQGAAAFFIERIEIAEAERVSPQVIVYESRLAEGRAYTEQQLREANDRLRRLPFILDATFALQKGSERDRFILVISVRETKPLFYLLDLVFFKKRSEAILVESSNEAVLGARFFTGPRGAFHFGFYAGESTRPFTRNFSTLQAGFTQYDVFGSGALVTVAVNQTLSPSHSKFLPEAVVALPLTSNQTLRVSYVETATPRLHERVIESRWSYNTTNDPFFPTRGTVISAGPVASYFDGVSLRPDRTETVVHNNALGIETEVKRYWELRGSASLASEILVGLADVDQRRDGVASDFIQAYGEGVLRLSRPLSTKTQSPSRLELTFRAYATGSDRVTPDPNELMELSVSWARRNAWGALRLGAGYAW
jgi:hypothetical protein